MGDVLMKPPLTCAAEDTALPLSADREAGKPYYIKANESPKPNDFGRLPCAPRLGARRRFLGFGALLLDGRTVLPSAPSLARPVGL